MSSNHSASPGRSRRGGRRILLLGRTARTVAWRKTLDGMGLHVVGASENRTEADLLTQLLDPDVVVLDTVSGPSTWSWPRLASRLAVANSRVAVVAVLQSPTAGFLRQLAAAGVWDVVVEPAPKEQLIASVLVARRRLSAASPMMILQRLQDTVLRLQSAVRGVAEGLAVPTASSAPGLPRLCDGLSFREQHVAHLLAAGWDPVEIAETLGVGKETVRTHRRSIYRKLNLHSRAELRATWRRDQSCPRTGETPNQIVESRRRE